MTEEKPDEEKMALMTIVMTMTMYGGLLCNVAMTMVYGENMCNI